SGGEIVLAAQRYDFVREWTQWGLNQLYSNLSDWLSERADRFVTFNVMPSLLRESHSVDWLIERLRELPDSFRQRLNLEITEQAIGNLIARDSLMTLRDMGVALYLDDFGAGDSNLYRLIDIQPEAIKLDKFLIDLILDDEPKLDVLSQVLSLARSISPRIIAEGIETEAQFKMIQQLDVDLIQGYYIGRRLDLSTGEPLGSSLPSSL
ncbi:MAG: EAL domain-containing protein, partial [Litorivicinus sp.]